jgi:hypothetical protein
VNDTSYLLTVAEARDISGLRIKCLYRLIARGEIQARKDGRTIYVRRDSLVAWCRGDTWQGVGGGARVLSISGRTKSGVLE